MRVVYVADADDDGFRYRCVHACEALRAAGVVANVRSLHDPRLLDELSSYSMVVLFRLPHDARVAAVIAQARSSGARIAFDPGEARLQIDGEGEAAFAQRNRLHALVDTLAAVDLCIAATPALVSADARLGKDTVVYPSGLSRAQVATARLVYPLRRAQRRIPTFAYVAARDADPADLASIAGALAHVMRRHADAQLVVAGRVPIPAELSPMRDRIVRIATDDPRARPFLFGRCRAIVVPVADPVDRAGEVGVARILESGVVGVPVVASATRTLLAVVEHGVTGFVARSGDEWIAGLETLLALDESLRMGAAARACALKDHAPAATQGVLARALLQHAGRHDARRPRRTPLELSAKGPLERLRGNARLARRSLSLAFAAHGALAAIGSPAAGVSSVQVGAEELAADDPFVLALMTGERRGDALFHESTHIGTLLADRTRPLARFRECANVASLHSPLGVGTAFRATTADPWFVIPWPAQAPAARFVYVELRVAGDGELSWPQLFWRARPRDGFAEGRSVRFPVRADGLLRRLLVDLHVPTAPLAWPDDAPEAIRFDPSDKKGELEVATLAFLADRPRPADDLTNLRTAIAARFLNGDGIEIGALQNPLRVPAGARVSYVDRLSRAQARVDYAELDGQPLVEPSILCEADQLTPIAKASQDFVVCNHVLEHMRDPIGALDEWLRVLRPGGALYVAIPDHRNPLDRLRALTTFEHLVRDHEERSARDGADREHFVDWTNSAHAAMSAEERGLHSAHLIATSYSIHFHVFDAPLYRHLLEYAAARNGAALVEWQERGLVPEVEYIAVLRKT